MRVPELSPRQWVAVGVVVGIVLSVVAGPVAALIVDFADGKDVRVSDGVTFESPSQLEVKLYGSTNVSVENETQTFPDNTTVRLLTEAGNFTATASSAAHLEVYTSNITGTWTNATNITAGSTTIEIYPENKNRTDVSGDLDYIGIRNRTVDDGTVDFYVSGNGGNATITVYDLPANTNVSAMDGDTFLASAETDSNGNASFTIPLSSHAVTLETENPDPPNATNGRPTGQVSSSPDTLKVDISDPDFPNDEVQVTYFVDGAKVGSKNTTSNGTVSLSLQQEFDLGETVKWNVTATDSYGEQDGENYSFTMPENITLRNESNASQIIKDANITATFYSANGEIVVVKSDNNGDGNISLAGLPDVPFVVTFEGSGWYDRRAYIDGIGEQANIYLLNTSAYPRANNSAIATTFTYEDRTGKFEQENTTLIIERAVDPDGDGNFTFATVAGDYWGAAGEFPFTGQYQQRYRLKIVNRETGVSRTLGTHIPTNDGIKEIIVGRIRFEAGNATGRYADAGINNSTNNLQFVYNDPTNETTDLTIVVYEQGNRSNEIYNQTFSGPLGRQAGSLQLTQNQSTTSWVVVFDGDVGDNVVYKKIPVGGVGYPLPIDPDILTSLTFIFMTFAMALYGPRTAVTGAWAGVLFVGGLVLLGWGAVSGVTLTVGVLVALGATFYSEAMPG